MTQREAHRARYIDGWNNRDLDAILVSIADGFVFDDPTDPAPVSRDDLAAYLPVWFDKAAALGAPFDFEMTERVAQDSGGVLIEWYWWRLAGTDVEGAAVVRTSDDGVVFERLSYYRSPWPLLR